MGNRRAREGQKKLPSHDEKSRNTHLTLRPNLGPIVPRTRSTRQRQKTPHPPPSPQRPRTPGPLGAPTLPPVHDGSSRLPSLARRPLTSLPRSPNFGFWVAQRF